MPAAQALSSASRVPLIEDELPQLIIAPRTLITTWLGDSPDSLMWLLVPRLKFPVMSTTTVSPAAPFRVSEDELFSMTSPLIRTRLKLTVSVSVRLPPTASEKPAMDCVAVASITAVSKVDASVPESLYSGSSGLVPLVSVLPHRAALPEMVMGLPPVTQETPSFEFVPRMRALVLEIASWTTTYELPSDTSRPATEPAGMFPLPMEAFPPVVTSPPMLSRAKFKALPSVVQDGSGVELSSYAPISQNFGCTGDGRTSPRWSVVSGLGGVA